MNVAVCLVSHGGAYRDHEKCLGALRARFPEWGFLELSGMPCVDLGRSSLAESALRHFRSLPRTAGEEKDLVGRSDVTLWIDADMTFSADTCESIVRSALEKNAVVGCLYAAKAFGKGPQVSFFDETIRSGEKITCFEGGGLLEVEAIGFGLVAVPALAFETIAEKLSLPKLRVLDRELRPWFTTRSDGGWENFHSDDYAFCRRAREAGYKIFADTRHRVGHIGLHTFHLEDALPLMRGTSFVMHSADKKERNK